MSYVRRPFIDTCTSAEPLGQPSTGGLATGSVEILAVATISSLGRCWSVRRPVGGVETGATNQVSLRDVVRPRVPLLRPAWRGRAIRFRPHRVRGCNVRWRLDIRLVRPHEPVGSGADTDRFVSSSQTERPASSACMARSSHSVSAASSSVVAWESWEASAVSFSWSPSVAASAVASVNFSCARFAAL